MSFFQNTVSNGLPARYMIAQYTPDPFRKEPRNVGIVVEKNGFAIAKFLGEREPGQWDSGRLRRFRHPNAYRLWVDHWRKLIEEATSADWRDKLLASNGESYTVIPGGELANTGADTPTEICRHLYSLLVSPGGLAEALTEAAEDEEPAVLKNDITAAFRDAGIMAGLRSVNHPVCAPKEVRGTKFWHRVAFYQEANREAWAMEPVDFTAQNKRMARDHAAYARYVFDDLRKRSASNGLNINTVAIVRMKPSEATKKDVKKGLEILQGVCRMVQWLDESERCTFIEERKTIANAA